MRAHWAFLLLCISASARSLEPPISIAPGRAEDGDWVHFYSRDFDSGRLDYFYDRPPILRDRGLLLARWKVVGNLGGEPSITLAVVEIDCLEGTFTERGTVLIDRGGRRELPQAELLINQPIKAGTSSDIFRRSFCPQQTASARPSHTTPNYTGNFHHLRDVTVEDLHHRGLSSI